MEEILAIAPPADMSGSTRGLAKAIAREREGMLVKVVDFESVASHAQVANCLIEETMSDSSLVEVGREGAIAPVRCARVEGARIHPREGDDEGRLAEARWSDRGSGGLETTG